MYGSRGLSDGFEGTKRARMVESNPYFMNSGASSDGYEVGSKRSRMMDSTNPYFMMSGAGGIYQPYNSSYSEGIGGVHSFPVVRLRGLPFACEELDVYRFFDGLNIVDCLLVNKDGRFSGEAFVVFPSSMQAELAIQRDRQNMGRRYVEVFQCSKQDYYRAVAAEVDYRGTSENGYQQSAPPARGKKKPYEDKEQMEYTEILKLRGLPYSVTESEIVDFFGEFELLDDNVCIARRPDGKATGEAYVEFPSAEAAKEAMRMDKMTIGSRYVELFPSTRVEAERAES